MKIIIAPTKKMRVDGDSLAPLTEPVYLDRSAQLLKFLNQLDITSLQKIWKTSDRLTQTAYKQLKQIDLNRRVTPALFAYDGLVFKHMAPHVMTAESYHYLQDHLRIISGFFGVLRPFDAIMPYRLEMGAKLAINDTHSLYDFWGDAIYKEVMKDDHLLINLASKEYAKCLYDYLQPDDRIIDIEFVEDKNNKLVTLATHAKIGRGLMVSYMADHQIENIEDLLTFHDYGYVYHDELSDDTKLVYMKEY